ncbi:sugar phosphate isomerase/epimerase [bacterium]|nr:sugar phosphate isomerase/epimerase [candidate division CSSED10-310 bacterium]
MKIGMMNNPATALKREIEYAKTNEFDFIDLTLEPPGACPHSLNLDAIIRRLERAKIDVVGHTAWFLPLDFPFEQIRRCAVSEVITHLDILKAFGAGKVTIHFRFSHPHRLLPRKTLLDGWKKTVDELLGHCTKTRTVLMIENGFHSEIQLEILDVLMDEFRELAFHLDVGHANLNTEMNQTPVLLKHFGDRLKHVHLSDNVGGTGDLHLPLGAGKIRWKEILNHLKSSGYDDTVTLEIFSPERQYLLTSRELLRDWWGSLPPP